MADVVRMEGQRATVGLTEAARLTGKNASTITRSRRSGKLSARADGNGNALFDVAELERVFGPLRCPDDAGTSANSVQGTMAHDALTRMHDAEKAALRQQIEGLQERLREKDALIEDTRRDRDHWRQQATALLTDQRTNEIKERRSWWRQLWGRTDER